MTKRLFVLFGLMMCAGAVAAEPLVDGDVEAGKTKAAQCAACHGPQGNMQSGQFPKLAGQGAPYIYEQLKLFKSGERQNGIMAGQVAGLNDQDMKNLAAYFADQQTRPGAADMAVAPAGAALYHGGNAEEGIPACSGCHGPSGLGNAAAKFPRLSGQSPQYVATQLKAYRDGKRSGYRNATIMNGVAENLSDSDIQALSSYVAGLAPSTGEGQGNDNGALMQNASAPSPAAAEDNEQSPSDAKASDEESDQADAAAKEKTGTAGGEAPTSDAADASAGDAAAQDQGEAADNAEEKSSSAQAKPEAAGAQPSSDENGASEDNAEDADTQ